MQGHRKVRLQQGLSSAALACGSDADPGTAATITTTNQYKDQRWDAAARVCLCFCAG
jgi:hypothetical protein